jgi:predicted HTH domain antitoxin
MKTQLHLKLDIPEGITLSEHDAAMIIAGQLYRERQLSLGEAAEIVGIPKREFIETMGGYGFSIFSDDPADLQHDFKTA